LSRLTGSDADEAVFCCERHEGPFQPDILLSSTQGAGFGGPNAWAHLRFDQYFPTFWSSGAASLDAKKRSPPAPIVVWYAEPSDPCESEEHEGRW